MFNSHGFPPPLHLGHPAHQNLLHHHAPLSQIQLDQVRQQHEQQRMIQAWAESSAWWKFVFVTLVWVWMAASVAAVIHAVLRLSGDMTATGYISVLVAFLFGPFYWVYVVLMKKTKY